MPKRIIIAIALIPFALVSCTQRKARQTPLELPEAVRTVPPPTEHRLGPDAERRGKIEREAWFEHMHRSAPDVDWRVVEKENGRAEQARRNTLGLAFRVGGPSHWTEVGSSNLAGRMHTAVIGPDGQTLYGGSALGGVWRGGLDGTSWEPLGDNLFGGAHELVVLPGESSTDPDVMVVATDGGELHISRDEGLVWESPVGIPDLQSIRGLGALQDPLRTILVYGRGPGTGYRPTLFASTDYGRTFSARWQGGSPWDGWMWVPRTGLLSSTHVYVVHDGKLWTSTDAGFSFPSSYSIAAGADRGVLAGSEGSGLVLYSALRIAGEWGLYRSDNAGQTWTRVHDIQDFWESLCASIYDASRVVYGGVEVHRSTDGGTNFTKLNNWRDYYDDPQSKLHADTPGLHCWPDPSQPGKEIWYVSSDGGTYASYDGMATVSNLSLQGVAVSQYYSTLSDRRNWDLVAAGSQDQGYQHGAVLRIEGTGPSTPFEQLISGDYGHLSSNDETRRLVYSTYPGFILVQDGISSPSLYDLDFPEGSLRAWLPPVVADPSIPETFYSCGDFLYRYDRTSVTEWTQTVHSAQQFGGPGVDGNYISALAFAPTDPDRVYAVTDAGLLFWSTDHGKSWTESIVSAPAQHYFYGNALAVHPDNPLEVVVGGSGYSNAGVIRSLDGGQTWFAEAGGLPQTMVYALAYAEDGSGGLYAGTETGAYHWDRATGQWENIMANEAPVTIYWSVEVVNDGGTARFGTHGRGIWDYAINPGDRDGDGVQDADDTCPNNVDPLQPDGDGDGVGDACDNCVATANAVQTDADVDLAGDVCDCAPLDASASTVPSEVAGLRFVDSMTLYWTAGLSLSEGVHVVQRGVLGTWPVGSSSACTDAYVAGTSIRDPSIPTVGSGFWYLARAANPCGDGSLGLWGDGEERALTTCDLPVSSFSHSLFTEETQTTPGLTGSYVNGSLFWYTVQDDWRISQPIAGTRVDTILDFTDTRWGSRSEVGLTNGTDENWDLFSVQWDGVIEILEAGVRLATISDDGSRMWLDLNRDGVFDTNGPEFINNNFGLAQSPTEGPHSVALQPGVYQIRIQYDEQYGGNFMRLISIPPQ